MTTRNIFLPDDTPSAADTRTEACGCGTSNAHTRDLIRSGPDRQALRALLDERRASEQDEPVTEGTFEALENRTAHGSVAAD